MEPEVRFASHAHLLWLNGYLPLIPIRYASKAPINSDWQMIGANPPTEEAILRSAPHYRNNGIGYVCDGTAGFLDLDIAVMPGMTDEEAARIFEASHKCEKLFVTLLGETIIRRSVSAKSLLMYRVAGDSCETRAGTAVELFSGKSSKQLVLYGHHPDGVEYRWPDGGPAEVRMSDLPLVAAEDLYTLRDKAIEICIKHGVKTKADMTARGAHAGKGLGAGGAVAHIMRDLLRKTARAATVDLFNDDDATAGSTDPVVVCQRAMANAGPGERGNTVAAAACVLAIKGYEDAAIVDALDALFQKSLADTGDASRDLPSIVSGVRRRMSRLYWHDAQPLSVLDRELHVSRWSSYP